MNTSFSVARKPRKPLSFSLLFFIVVGLFGLAFLASEWRSDQKVRKISVEGNSLVNRKEILELAAIVPDSARSGELNLLAIKAVVETHPFVKFAAVMYSKGDELLIKIQERVPTAYLITRSGDVQFVDEEGSPLPLRQISKALDIPLLTGFFTTDKADTANIRHALEILRLIRTSEEKIYRNISEISLKNNQFTLLTTDGAVPIFFGTAESTTAKVEKLAIFWKSIILQPERQDITQIDLRWQKQVVVRSHRTQL